MLSRTRDVRQDAVCALSPFERRGVFVPCVEELFDSRLQLLYAFVRTAVSAPMATILATSVSVWPGRTTSRCGHGQRGSATPYGRQQRFALVIGKLNTNTRATRARRISQIAHPSPQEALRHLATVRGVLAPGNLVVRKPLGARQYFTLKPTELSSSRSKSNSARCLSVSRT